MNDTAKTEPETTRSRIKAARRHFVPMAACYSLGVFNDHFYKQTIMLLAVSAGRQDIQGIATVVFTLPYLIAAAPAGWLADRFRRRDVIIGAKALELAAMICGAAGLLIFDPKAPILSAPWILVLAMLGIMGFQSSLFSPALNGSIPQLYPECHVQKANGTVKVVTTLAILAGIAVAGMVLGTGKASDGSGYASQTLMTVSGVVVAIAMLGLLASLGAKGFPAAGTKRPFPWTGPWESLKSLAEIRSDRLLATTVAACSLFWFVGMLQVLLINEMGVAQFNWTEGSTSLLLVAQMLGVAVGAVVVGRLRPDRWYDVLAPSLAGMGFFYGLLFATPHIFSAWGSGAAWYFCAAVLALAGVAGGINLIPMESFIQIRPDDASRGRVIAASNFAALGGTLLAGPVYMLATAASFAPTVSFLIMASCLLIAALGLAAALAMSELFEETAYRGGPRLLEKLLARVSSILLSLRYSVEVRGLEKIADRGHERILFLPNHVALVDSLLIMDHIYGPFRPRTIAVENYLSNPVVGWLARRFGVMTMPDMARVGISGRHRIDSAIAAVTDGVAAGGNLLLFPAGRMKRRINEVLGANSAVETILDKCRGARVVLVRQNGLWGSSFSRASGRAPSFVGTFARGALILAANLVFFTPRRKVLLEFVEPDDLPIDKGRMAMNLYMEEFYNTGAWPSTRMPCHFLEPGGPVELPEPEMVEGAFDPDAAPEGTRAIVYEYLRNATGISSISPETTLAYDLAMDSIARAEMISWLEGEFGFPQGDTDSYSTVSDVLAGACGAGLAAGNAEAPPPPAKWFSSGPASGRGARCIGPAADNINGAFLDAAARAPGRVVYSDAVSGARTYRDLVTSIMVLKPFLEDLPGDRLGILLPAGVGASTVYLATLFSGKTPVMVNWTTGVKNITHCLNSVGVKKVITSTRLLDKLKSQGLDLAGLDSLLLPLEALAPRIGLSSKISAFVKSRVTWAGLRSAAPPEHAVILFTSGSEASPKAVPLTHGNILCNLRDILKIVHLTDRDSVMGFLPPFHSFGLTVTTVLPALSGVAVAYHPNPMDSKVIAATMASHRTSMLVSTPTFLGGILSAAGKGDLDLLRLVVTGAEKCPESLHARLAAECPKALVLEGYGLTECSPVVTLNDPADPRPGTIGKLLPSMEMLLVDPDTGEPVDRDPGTLPSAGASGPSDPVIGSSTAGSAGANAMGMLLVRGPSVFPGYLNPEAASPFVEAAGKTWYRTGDLVRIGPDRVITFAGRLKRFVKIGGEMVSLPAIEEALGPYFENLAARGVTHADGTSVASGDSQAASDATVGPLMAVESTPGDENPEVVLFTTVEVDRGEVNGAIRDAGLSPIHNIRRIVRTDAIPVLGTGKIDYRGLKDSL